jgi:hypothetical protein
MTATINVAALRIRIPDIDYSTREFEYLTPTPGYEAEDDNNDEYCQEDQEDQEEVVGGWSYQHIRKVTFTLTRMTTMTHFRLSPSDFASQHHIPSHLNTVHSRSTSILAGLTRYFRRLLNSLWDTLWGAWYRPI